MIDSAFLIYAGVVCASAVLILFFAATTAPFGYEDEAGFHYGVLGSETPQHARARTSVENKTEAGLALAVSDYFARQGMSVGGTN